MGLFSPRGAYHGRLAFDSDTGFHIDPKGRKVVTYDFGQTWRYTKRGDSSHNARYQTRVAGFAGTTETDPHHFDVLPTDPHFGGLVSHPDAAAPAVTSHTEAQS